MRDWRSTLHSWLFCQVQSHVTQKLGQMSKIRPDQISILWRSLRIGGHLPVPIVNGGGDSFWKWKDFQLWRDCDLDIDSGSSHIEYRRASLIDLCIHTKFHWNRKNVLWTDGWTFETHIIRSTLKSDLIVGVIDAVGGQASERYLTVADNERGNSWVQLGGWSVYSSSGAVCW